MAKELSQGVFLKFLRKLRGWDRATLAEESGILEERIAEYEREEVEPSESEMERLGAALGLESWGARNLAWQIAQQTLDLMVGPDEGDQRQAAERTKTLVTELERLQREPKREPIS